MTGHLIDLDSLWETKYYYLSHALHMCKYAASSNIDTRSCAKNILWPEVFIAPSCKLSTTIMDQFHLSANEALAVYESKQLPTTT